MKPGSRIEAWTDREIAVLRAMYPNTLCRIVGEELGRSVPSIQAKAYKLGIEGPGRGRRMGVVTLKQRVLDAVREAGADGITSDELSKLLAPFFPRGGKDLLTTIYRCVQCAELVSDGRSRNRRIWIAPKGTPKPQRKAKAPEWTERELAIVRTQYPSLGRDRIAEMLGRTRRAVGSQARLLGVRCEVDVKAMNRSALPKAPEPVRLVRREVVLRPSSPKPVVPRGPAHSDGPVSYHPDFKFTRVPTPPAAFRTNTFSAY
jgi:hypothetical protein